MSGGWHGQTVQNRTKAIPLAPTLMYFRDKYYEYLVHVPVIIRGRRRSGRKAGAGYERRDWLPVNELGGATRHPAHLTEEQVAQRVRQQVEASLDPGGPILQLSDGGQHPEHAPQELQNGGGDAPAPAHEGPEERELPAALRGGRAAERLRGQAALCAPAAGRAAAAERGGGARALSLEGVSQMVYILPERLLALVRPAFDLVLRRIRSLKRCVQA